MVGVLTGAVAGLATITPAAGYIRPWAAVIVGILASIVCYLAVQVRIKLDWDDALDVWGVHGVGGILGSILVGVFAVSAVNGTSGLIEGNLHQFLIQTFGVVFTGLYAFVVTYAILKVINIFDTVRVPQKIEIQGLDSSIHGEVAYEL